MIKKHARIQWTFHPHYTRPVGQRAAHAIETDRTVPIAPGKTEICPTGKTEICPTGKPDIVLLVDNRETPNHIRLDIRKGATFRPMTPPTAPFTISIIGLCAESVASAHDTTTQCVLIHMSLFYCTFVQVFTTGVSDRGSNEDVFLIGHAPFYPEGRPPTLHPSGLKIQTIAFLRCVPCIVTKVDAFYPI